MPFLKAKYKNLIQRSKVDARDWKLSQIVTSSMQQEAKQLMDSVLILRGTSNNTTTGMRGGESFQPRSHLFAEVDLTVMVYENATYFYCVCVLTFLGYPRLPYEYCLN